MLFYRVELNQSKITDDAYITNISPYRGDYAGRDEFIEAHSTNSCKRRPTPANDKLLNARMFIRYNLLNEIDKDNDSEDDYEIDLNSIFKLKPNSWDAWKYYDNHIEKMCDLSLFGFSTIKQFFKWFTVKQIECLHKLGFVLSVYDVPDNKVIIGHSQTTVLKQYINANTLQEFLPIKELLRDKRNKRLVL